MSVKNVCYSESILCEHVISAEKQLSHQKISIHSIIYSEIYYFPFQAIKNIRFSFLLHFSHIGISQSLKYFSINNVQNTFFFFKHK